MIYILKKIQNRENNEKYKDLLTKLSKIDERSGYNLFSKIKAIPFKG